MTRKDICKHCVEERATHPLQRWGEMDEDAWERGFVWCCTKGYGTSANSINKPPGWCPYAIEIIVLTQENPPQ